MNKVILMGNVGSDPQIRYVGSRPVASFRLATNEPPRKGADGTLLPEITEWRNIVMWDAAAETAEKYIRKGTRMLVEGKLRTRFWEDRNAIKHTITEILVNYFDIIR